MSATLTIEGKLIEIYDAQQVSDKFKKREFIIETSEEYNGKTYNAYAKLQLSQAKCDILDKYSKGDIVSVNFNVKGFKWDRDGKTNYANTLEAWQISKAKDAPATNTTTITTEPYNPATDPNSDLPF